MAEILLVDGYNIISQWPDLAVLKEENLESARDKLCEMLAAYVPYRWDRVFVVFDAYQVPGRKREITLPADLTVIFSGEGETADVVIERLAGEMASLGHRVEVATSDAMEQLLVLGRGATRFSAKELLRELEQLSRRMQEQYRDDIDERHRQKLAGRLDESVRRFLDEWRRRKF